jgi:hypothetical protein
MQDSEDRALVSIACQAITQLLVTSNPHGNVGKSRPRRASQSPLKFLYLIKACGPVLNNHLTLS